MLHSDKPYLNLIRLRGSLKPCGSTASSPVTLGDVPGLFLYTIVKNQITGATIRIANADQANRQPMLFVAMKAVATIAPATNIVTGQYIDM